VKKIQIDPRSSERIARDFPWVFANEIKGSLKGFEVGELVELYSNKDKFLGVGYINPHSLICVRLLSRTSPVEVRSLLFEKLHDAYKYRKTHGLAQKSHRLCFGEADGLPGLTIDNYKFDDGSWSMVFQVTTAGMEKFLEGHKEVFALFAEEMAWERFSVIERMDSRARKMEGLPILEEAKIWKDAENLSAAAIELRALAKPLLTSLTEGQKTGLFLDQQENLLRFKELLRPRAKEALRCLDLFSYVGQWTAAAQEMLPHAQAEFHVADASEAALHLARKNCAHPRAQFHKKDLLKGLADFEGAFDVVVCDPPALIQSKKDLAAGKRAYLKLNAGALRALRPGGLGVSCSCSQHLSETDLLEILEAAAAKASKRLRILGQGQQALDHPRLLDFPQSYYLKALFFEIA
jgi:23S rRNA (cytosine1962-C5)-methyltransferase